MHKNMSVSTKEVLVVFGNRRRPVSFDVNPEKSDKEVLLEAVLTSFSDVLEAKEGQEYYLQIEHEKYGLIDLMGAVADGAIVHLCLDAKATTVTNS